jgi:hypothetical protein
MKKKIPLWLIMTFMISILICFSCSEKEESKKIAKIPDPVESVEIELLHLMPENTQFLVKFSDLKTLYEEMAVTENSLMGIPLKEKDIEAIKSNLGFNPLNPDHINAAGFDPEKPFCLALTNIKLNAADNPSSNVDILGLFPVSDSVKAYETIRTSFTKNKVVFKEIIKNNTSFFKWSKPEINCCLAIKGQYLYLSINLQADPQPFLKTVLENKTSLINAKAFRDVYAETDFKQELIFYINISDLMETNLNEIKQVMAEKQPEAAPNMLKLFESIKDYSSATIVTDTSSQNLEVNTTVALVPDSKIKKIWNVNRINRETVLSIIDPAVLLLSFGADFMQYYKMITDMMPSETSSSVKTRLASIKENYDIDIENDLINNLDGSVNLAFYDGASITMLNYNSLFTATVKDEATMKKVIDKAIMLLPPKKQAMISRQKIGEKNAYVLNAGLVQIYAVVDNHKFLLASGKPLIEKALNEQKDTGFVANLTDERLKNTLTSNQNIFYLSIDEVVKIINNFAMFLTEPAGGEIKFKDKLKAANQFEYLLSSSEINENLINSELTIKTRFSRPFFTEVANMIHGLNLYENNSKVYQ